MPNPDVPRTTTGEASEEPAIDLRDGMSDQDPGMLSIEEIDRLDRQVLIGIGSLLATVATVAIFREYGSEILEWVKDIGPDGPNWLN